MFKKFFILSLLFTVLFSVTVFAQKPYSTVRVVHFGEIQVYSTPARNYNGVVMVPLRETFEKTFNCTVEWQESDRSIIVKSSDSDIKIQEGSNTMYVNGSAVELNNPPVSYAGKLYVPTKVITSGLEIGLGYDYSRDILVVGVAPDINNIDKFIPVDASEHTDAKIEFYQTDYFYNFNDLYVADYDDDFYNLELKGHPYEENYKVLFCISKNDGISNYSYHVKYNEDNYSKLFTWTDPNGIQHTDTYGDIFGEMKYYKSSYGSEWCAQTFGEIYVDYQNTHDTELTKIIEFYIRYMMGY